MDLLGCVMDGWWNHHGVINHRDSVDPPGCVTDGWWNHPGVIFVVEYSINGLGIRGCVCLPGCGMVGRITLA